MIEFDNLTLSWGVGWGTWIALATCVATWGYALLVLVTLIYVHLQFQVAKNDRKLQAALTVFKELQTTRARNARRKLYKEVPVAIIGLGDEDLEKYLEIAQAAILPFDRIGFLIQEGHMDADPILISCWALVWRSWKKVESVITWARERRGEPTYLYHFKHLFDLAEAYRIENNLPEPKIH